MSRKTLDLKIVGLTAVLLFAAGAVAFSGLDAGDDVAEVESVSADSLDDDVEWVNTITVEKNGDVIHESTNTLTDQGQDWIAAMISQDDGGDFDDIESGDTSGAEAAHIAVGEPTDVDSGHVHLENEYTSDDSELGAPEGVIELGTDSMDRQTVDSEGFEANPDGVPGEFDVEVEFTYSDDGDGAITVEGTSLNFFNYDPGETGEDDEFESMISGAEFDNDAVLEDDDELTVTHEIQIQEG